jgi:hypothetical protein
MSNTPLSLPDAAQKYVAHCNNMGTTRSSLKAPDPDLQNPDPQIRAIQIAALHSLRNFLERTQDPNPTGAPITKQEVTAAYNRILNHFRSCREQGDPDEAGWKMFKQVSGRAPLLEPRDTEWKTLMWVGAVISIGQHWGYGYEDLMVRMGDEAPMKDALVSVWEAAYEFLMAVMVPNEWPGLEAGGRE